MSPRCSHLLVALCAVVVAVAGVLAIAAPAWADPSSTTVPVEPTRPGPEGRHGPTRVVYPTVEEARGRARDPHQAGQASGRGLLEYGGGVDGIGVTTGSPRVYVVFWGSQWGTSSTGADGYVHLSGDPQGIAPRVQALLAGLGTNGETWSGVMTQYCEGVSTGATSCPANSAHVGYPTGGALAGVWVDGSAAAPNQASGHQLALEAIAAAAHFGNTSAAANRNAQYVVVSPTHTHPDGFNTRAGQFCAYHDYNGDSTLTGGAAVSPYGDVAFTNLPYVTDLGASCGASFVNAGATGVLDGVTIVEGHEYAETITDQNPAGGWTDQVGYEAADKCAWIGGTGPQAAQDVAFSTGSFAMQSTFANDSNSCAISHPIVTTVVGNDFAVSVSPASATVAQGTSTTPITVATQVTSGAAQTVGLSLGALPAGVTATLTPSSVTAGGSAQLTLTAASNAATGAAQVTVTGTGAAATHSTPLTLTVTPANDFSIAMAPTSVSAAQGSSTQSTAQLSVTAGAAQNVNLSVSGQPAGMTATFATNPVTSSGSSVLGITVGSATAPGTYTLTITGTGTSATHTAQVAVGVTTVGGVGIVNGGFETGNLSGWTVSGTASVVSPGHTGNFAARAGSTTPTNGDSTIVQSFTAPSGTHNLSLWYAVHCPGTVRNDWATVTLLDTTTNRSQSLLPHTCTNGGAWTQIRTPVTAGHRYTLTLLSHDDNQAATPTYTLYDDVLTS